MKITVIDGNPSEQSFTAGLVEKYIEGAKGSGHEVRRLNIRDLKFDPNLVEGYREIQELEPDLIKAQQDIQWCQHLVLAYPIWWGQMPALLKGFFDRALLPGFGFKYHKKGPWWDRLLAGRSARPAAQGRMPSGFQ